MRTRIALVGAALLVGTTTHAAELRPHVEVDPLPFVRHGYGAQVGVRPSALRGVRLAVASFMLDVPDLVTRFGGNDGFHARVRPSGALYALYYPYPHDSVAVGVSIRYLRLTYTHDERPDLEATVSQISPELVVGFQWHPTSLGFYVQPWMGLGVVAWQSKEVVVGARTYTALPISPFFTVNLGWEWP